MSTIDKKTPFKILNAFKSQNIQSHITASNKDKEEENDFNDSSSELQLLSVVKIVSKISDKIRVKQVNSQSGSYLLCNKDAEKKFLLELNQSIAEKLDDFLQLSDEDEEEYHTNSNSNSSPRLESCNLSITGDKNNGRKNSAGAENDVQEQTQTQTQTRCVFPNKKEESFFQNLFQNSDKKTPNVFSNLCRDKTDINKDVNHCPGENHVNASSELSSEFEEKNSILSQTKLKTSPRESLSNLLKEKIANLLTQIISQIFINCKAQKRNPSDIKNFQIIILDLVKEDSSYSLISVQFVINYFFSFMIDQLYKETWSLVNIIQEKFKKVFLEGNLENLGNLITFEAFWIQHKKEGKEIIKIITTLILNYKETAKVFDVVFKPMIDEFIKFTNFEYNQINEISIHSICLEQIWAIVFSNNFFLTLFTITKLNLIENFSIYQKFVIELEEEVKKCPKVLKRLSSVIIIENENYLKGLIYELDIDAIEKRVGIKIFLNKKIEKKDQRKKSEKNIDELYEYIISEDVEKSGEKDITAKKKKNRKKKKNKKLSNDKILTSSANCTTNTNSNSQGEENINQSENNFIIDQEVESFKRLITGETINAKQVNKIKPHLKGELMNIINKQK